MNRVLSLGNSQTRNMSWWFGWCDNGATGGNTAGHKWQILHLIRLLRR
jgi:hypothetical protein